MIWWTKSQMKWSETVRQELTGKDGGGIVIQINNQDTDLV
jgi:hypothetical protein